MDFFRILMVLPSVFARGWDHFGRKMTPPGGVPETPFWGSGGDPPHPPGRGGVGGTPPNPVWGPTPGGGSRTPPGGGTPPSRRGGNPGQKGPPPGSPFFAPQIRVKK